ncbi:hypothetical protein GGI19_001944 [Coemansia pectinata]|uniref:RAD50-interacting protein 1 n=1 Tax=Coemansia pectinata TaxID=1052879 RepID=A0A9W8LAT0_9FUNG|nr:hypothetical protein GGI19_001944 [Coemansia pectinata]
MTNIEADVALEAARRFLDGHFATLESLELIDDLLSGEENTHAQLQSDLENASRATEALRDEAVDISQSLRDKALALIDLHSEVVGAAADDNVSAWQFRDGTETMDLVATLATELQSYDKLSRAKTYIDALLEVEQAKQSARQSLSTNPQGMLSAYSKLIAILAAHSNSGSLAPLTSGSATSDCSADSPPQPSNLLEYIKQSVQEIWSEANEAAASAQSESLTKLGWPAKMDLSSAAAVGAFDASFSTLAGLDHITRAASDALARCGLTLRADDAPPLPLEHMARAVDIRMRYHFESARTTSRADKPEWWLSQVLGMLRNIVPFLESHVQRLFNGTTLPQLDARNEFICLVLPVVQRKLTHDRSEYIRDGLVIAHVVHELADFEHTLRDVYFYDGPSVLGQFLADSALFSAWVEAERANAVESYMQTIAESNPFELVYEDDMLGADDAKPSRLAEKVVLVIEDVAERYAVVPSCMQRLQLLSTAQFPILIALVEDIEGEIDEFSRISLAFIRDAGITNAIATKPTTATQSPLVSQLARLTSWYQTIWYVEEAADDWNNSATYVDMWAAVCQRAAALGRNTDPRDWRVNCDEWSDADRALLDETTHQSLANDDWLDGGIWERSIGTLRELKQRVLDIISRAINKDVVGQLRAYRKKNNWAAEGIGANADTDISIELSGLLPELSSVLAALETMVPSLAFSLLLRQLAAELDTFLVERVALAHSFSQCGGRQFAKDIGALSQLLGSSTARGATKKLKHRVLLKSRECSLILACSLDSTTAPAANDMPLSLDEWGPTVISSDASDRETKLVLKKLGISNLSAKEARSLVGLRVDFAELTGCNT